MSCKQWFLLKISVDAVIVAILSELDGVFTLEEKQKDRAFLGELHCFTLLQRVCGRNNLIGLGVLLNSVGKGCLLDVCYKNKVKIACIKRTLGTLVWSGTNIEFFRRSF